MQQGAHHDHDRDSHGSIRLNRQVIWVNGFASALKEGPHAGRHAIQHFYYQRVAPGVETTVWYEEIGALVHTKSK